MHASAVDHGNLFIIVASVELPCLRKIRLSVHAMAWLWETNGANRCHSGHRHLPWGVLSHVLCRKPVQAVEEHSHTLGPQTQGVVHAREDLVISDGVGLAPPVVAVQRGDARFPDQLILTASGQQQWATLHLSAACAGAVPHCMEQYR